MDEGLESDVSADQGAVSWLRSIWVDEVVLSDDVVPELELTQPES